MSDAPRPGDRILVLPTVGIESGPMMRDDNGHIAVVLRFKLLGGGHSEWVAIPVESVDSLVESLYEERDRARAHAGRN